MVDNQPKGQIPYVMASGTITKTLNAIRLASTPPRFTQDFLETKLAVKGGSGRPVLPFLKRTGFLGTDGVPTELYKRFRNPTSTGAAAAQALKTGYAALYEVNESCHLLSDKDVKGLILQITGSADGSSTVGGIMASFKALKAFADFDATGDSTAEEDAGDGVDDAASANGGGNLHHPKKLGISYTINLNLPATSDVAVFNAIFRALNEHLLK